MFREGVGGGGEGRVGLPRNICISLLVRWVRAGVSGNAKSHGSWDFIYFFHSKV